MPLMDSYFDPQRSEPVTGNRLRSRVAIVADSATDILPSHAQMLGITVVPHRVILDGRAFRDGIDISPAQFFAYLPRVHNMPYTEPVSPDDLYYAYQSVFQRGATDIVSIHVSSRLSQTVRHAQMVQDYMAPAPIQVIDSQQAGIGMWPAITHAAKIAGMGASVQEVVDATIAILAHTKVFFLVESLEYLRRGGRIRRIQEWIGTMLDAHPILTVRDGDVEPVETVRPRERSLFRLSELALAEGPIETLLICGSSIEFMAELEDVLQQHYRGTIQKTWLGPSLGANIGPAVAIAVATRRQPF
jgi:DegV family protein with EDD domain